MHSGYLHHHDRQTSRDWYHGAVTAATPQQTHRGLRAAAFIGTPSLLIAVVWCIVFVIAPQGAPLVLTSEYFALWSTLPTLALSWYVLPRLQMFGGMRSAVGRAGVLLVLAGVFWSVGEILWFTATTCEAWGPFSCAHQRAVPYPSLPDWYYLAYYPCVVLGLGSLARPLNLTRVSIRQYWWAPLLALLVVVPPLLPPTTLGGLTFGADLLRTATDDPAASAVTALYMAGDVSIVSLAVIVASVSRKLLNAALLIPSVAVLISVLGTAIADGLFFSELSSGNPAANNASDLIYGMAAPVVVMGFLWFVRTPLPAPIPVDSSRESWLQQVIEGFVDRHFLLLGPSAMSTAESVEGLTLADGGMRVTDRSSLDVLVDLHSAYSLLTGGLSTELLTVSLDEVGGAVPSGARREIFDAILPADPDSIPVDREIAPIAATVLWSMPGLAIAQLVLVLALDAGSGPHGPSTLVPLILACCTLVLVGFLSLYTWRTRRLGLLPIAPIAVGVAGALIAASSPATGAMNFAAMVALALFASALYSTNTAFAIHFAITGILLSVVSTLRHDIPDENAAALIVLVISTVVSAVIRGRVRESRRTARALEESNRMLSDLVTKIDESRVDERHRIAGEIHDFALQNLLAVQMYLRNVMQTGNAIDKEQLVLPSELLGSSIESLRSVVEGVEPFSLFDANLSSAIDSLVVSLTRTYAVPITCSIHTSFDVPVSTQLILYRVIAEALTNAAKHSQSDVIELDAHSKQGVMTIVVTDHGSGFAGGIPDLNAPESSSRAGFGLRLMTEQVRQLGGRVEAFATPDGGTTLSIIVPHAATVSSQPSSWVR